MDVKQDEVEQGLQIGSDVAKSGDLVELTAEELRLVSGGVDVSAKAAAML